MKRLIFSSLMILFVAGCSSLVEETNPAPKTLKVLIVDGQNNHNAWPLATSLIKQALEETKKFEVDVYRTQYTWRGEKFLAEHKLTDGKTYQALEMPKSDPTFAPSFNNYDVVISNFGWRAANWPKSTQLAFEQYMKNGGGFVAFHAADNSFPKWQAFNEMIGLGGWGGRNEKDGPYVYFDDNGKLIKDMRKGGGGGHGKQHQFTITNRDAKHPIMRGLPETWLHAKDELYNRLRGPAQNMTVLASAYDNPKYNGSGRHEPVLMTISYHQGRVFHSTLGHGEKALRSGSFMTTLLRGTEWAASGDVTISFKNLED